MTTLAQQLARGKPDRRRAKRARHAPPRAPRASGDPAAGALEPSDWQPTLANLLLFPLGLKLVRRRSRRDAA